jgi:Domain of unknown function (DUF5753)
VSCAWIGSQAGEPGRARAHRPAGGFAIADLPDLPGIVFLDSVADGQTIEDPAIVSQVTQRFDALRAEALPRGASGT